MSEKAPIMTDEEVAELFGISVDCLQRKMRNGFAKDETDLRKAKPERLGRRRWWSRVKVEAIIAGK